MRIKLPEDVLWILGRLNDAGCRAYAVGGCVRDSLLGIAPHDWDICTSALPEQMRAVFAGEHVLDIGLKHGTLTVMRAGKPYEITTFRVDGAYTDHRHPDGVTFVTDVREDLARRDFTVNAMAYHPEEGLIDAFHGMEDLRLGVIRCVGEPMLRFEEDALRILRGLRFAATYGFTVESATLEAAFRLKKSLSLVAAERKRVELCKLLCGRAAEKMLRIGAPVIGEVIPELRGTFGFEQRNPHHRYDVWEHTLHAVAAAEPDEIIRLAMLLHDAGKPDTFSVDEAGVGHFYGHAKRSAELAEAAMSRLKFDRATETAVTELVLHHDLALEPSARMMRRRLMQLGEQTVRRLIAVQRADAVGTGLCDPAEADARAASLREALQAVLDQQACFQLRDLAVNGRDMTALGLRGAAIGRTLQSLLEAVVDERLPNEREALMKEAAMIENRANE